jgi:hypothetical protein
VSVGLRDSESSSPPLGAPKKPPPVWGAVEKALPSRGSAIRHGRLRNEDGERPAGGVVFHISTSDYRSYRLVEIVSTTKCILDSPKTDFDFRE